MSGVRRVYLGQENIIEGENKRLRLLRSPGAYALVVASLFAVFLHTRTESLTAIELLIGGMVGLAVGASLLRSLVVRVSIPKPVGYLLLYGLVVCLNLVVATGFDVPFSVWLRKASLAGALPFFTFAAVATTSRARAIRSYYLLAMICVLVGAYLIVNIPMGFQRSAAVVRALRTTRFDVPYLAYAGSLLTCLAFPVLVLRRRSTGSLVPTALSAFALLLGVLSLVLSFSRSLWAATGIAVVAMATLIHRSASARLRRRLVLALLVVLLLCGLLFLTPLADVVHRRVTTLGFSMAQRVQEARGILSTMAERPITLLVGMGFGSEFQMYSVSAHASAGTGEILRTYSHNYLLYLLWTTGLIGLGTMLAFALSFWRLLMLGIRLSRRDSSLRVVHRALIGISGAFVSVAIASLTIPPFGILPWTILISMLIGIGSTLATCVVRERSVDSIERLRRE